MYFIATRLLRDSGAGPTILVSPLLALMRNQIRMAERAEPSRSTARTATTTGGHDFRPDYRRLVRVLELLPQGVPVLCTTATANDRVIEEDSQDFRSSD